MGEIGSLPKNPLDIEYVDLCNYAWLCTENIGLSVRYNNEL